MFGVQNPLKPLNTTKSLHLRSALFRCSFDIEGPANSFERSQRRNMNVKEG